MKRMLIIGNKIDGIKSVPFNEVKSVNITDYQIILIDLTNYQDIDSNLCDHIRYSLTSLYLNRHPIIFILPRKGFTDAHPTERLFRDARIHVRHKSGSTVFFKNEPLINVYKSFITKHEVVFGKDLISDIGSSGMPLMWNNINEHCSTLMNSLYLLHPPDKGLHKKAIESIVKYFSPDMEEEKEDKPDWVEPYELNNLGLQEIEKKINEIGQGIVKLSDKRNDFVVEKEKIAIMGRFNH